MVVSSRQSSPRGHSALLFWAAVVLILAAFVAWQWRGIHALPWKYDEGLNVAKAQLLSEGHALYLDVWSDQPPAFTVALLVGFRVLGSHIWVGRLLVLLCVLLGAGGAAYLGRAWHGTLAGLVGVGTLLLLPHTQELSRLIMIGLPAIALATASIALLVAYREHGGAWLAALAGALLAASLLTKAITAPLLLVELVLLLGGRGEDERSAASPESKTALLAWVLGGAVPLALTALVAKPGAMFTQVVGTLGGARSFHGLDMADNVSMLADYFLTDKWGLSYTGLGLVAALGLGALWRNHRRTEALALIIWLVACGLALLWQTPLRRHHIILLMPALCIAAGIGVGSGWSWLKPQRRSIWRWALALVCLGLLGYDVGRCVKTDIADRQSVAQIDAETQSGLGAVAYLQAATPPGSLIVTDDPMLAFLAGRSIPAALAVPSARRIEAGELTDQVLLDVVGQQRPVAIMLWEQRLARLDGFVQWARQNYTVVRAYEDSRWILAAPELMGGPGVFAQAAGADNGVDLQGLRLDNLAVDPGGTFSLDVLMQTSEEVEADCTLFVHLLEPDGTRIAGHDLVPLDGQYPPREWSVGERLAQHVEIRVPPDAQPGAKLLAYGLYDTQGRVALAGVDDQDLPSSQMISMARPVVRWQAQMVAPVVSYSLDAILGDVVRLAGLDTAREPGKFVLDLSWQALAPMWDNYTVFVHVYQHEVRVGQQDQQPGQGRFPTVGWVAGEYINDHYEITLSQDASADEPLQLAVGMYRLDTGERLPVLVEGVSQPNGQLEISID